MTLRAFRTIQFIVSTIIAISALVFWLYPTYIDK